MIPLAEAHQRAGVLSVLFLISYFAMGVPAVFAGIRVVYGGGVASAAREYGFHGDHLGRTCPRGCGRSRGPREQLSLASRSTYPSRSTPSHYCRRLLATRLIIGARYGHSS